MEWPPEQNKQVRRKTAEWAAWYSGDRRALETVNSDYGTVGRADGRNVKTPGLVQRVWRRFWGGTVDDTNGPRIKVHVPLAADIARASADLLFSEPPSVQAVQVNGEPHPYLESLLDEGFWGVLAGAAETCAALGGVYLRVVWVQGALEKDRRVFVTRVDTDCAVPEFQWGTLVNVRFWKVLTSHLDKSIVWRHLELHELNVFGVGEIEHQLWQGTSGDLGQRVPLADHPTTASLVSLIDTAEGRISTRTPGLDVVYIPNVTPNPLWREDPVGQHLGAPDIAGSEDLLDRCDHVLSAWLREVDLGKARLIAPEYMLDFGKPGEGAFFDSDREIWSPLNISNPGGGVAQPRPEMFQPEIRGEEYNRVFQELIQNIVRSAGYSAATFGEDESGAVTATEVNAKTARSRLTRSKKIRHWSTGLQELVEKLIAVALALEWVDENPAELASAEVVIQFPQPQQTPLELANTALALFQAQAASIETRVKLAHPDWEDQEVEEEVDRIKQELSVAAPAVPDSFGADEEIGVDPFGPQPVTVPDEALNLDLPEE